MLLTHASDHEQTPFAQPPGAAWRGISTQGRNLCTHTGRDMLEDAAFKKCDSVFVI